MNLAALPTFDFRVQVTAEDMEAYRRMKVRHDDPMAKFVDDDADDEDDDEGLIASRSDEKTKPKKKKKKVCVTS